MLIVSTLPVAAFAAAQETVVSQLDPLVITASKAPTKASNLIAQTTVITEADLAHHPSQNLLNVLKTQAGISHYSSGGTEKTSNFYLRGFDSSAVLVLIDGVPYGSLTTGQPALGTLSASEVERIEITHGASGASLYGANAVGGVIQIFTKKGSLDGTRLSVNVGTGSHHALSYGMNVNFSNKNSYLNLSASHSQSNGINAINSPHVDTQRDKDGFDKTSVSVSATQRFDRLELGMNALGSHSKVAYDDIWTHESDIYTKQTAGAASTYLTYDYADDSTLKVQYGESIDHSTHYASTAETGTFDSTQKQLSLSLVHAMGVGKLLAGAEHLNQKVTSDTAYAQNSRDNTGYYLGYQASHGKLDTQSFIRHDDHAWYGSDTHYNVGLAYRISPLVRMGANYATGFKAPTFNQLYYPNGGNPNLRPESSKNSEVFIELLSNTQKTRLTAYHSDVTDLITGWPSQNIGQAEILGASLNSDWQIGNYQAGISYDYQEANSTTPTVTGEKTKSNLPVRPEHKGSAYIGYALDGISLRAEYQKIGSYYISNNHGDKMPSYALVNLSGSYELHPNLHLNTRLNNVLNKKYTTIESFGTRYQEDGINFHAALTMKY